MTGRSQRDREPLIFVGLSPGLTDQGHPQTVSCGQKIQDVSDKVVWQLVEHVHSLKMLFSETSCRSTNLRFIPPCEYGDHHQYDHEMIEPDLPVLHRNPRTSGISSLRLVQRSTTPKYSIQELEQIRDRTRIIGGR